MFDVHWTDPNVESVGQRRARKKAEKAEKGEKVKEDEKSGRTSVSTRSSSSSADKAFGFFGGKGSKKNSTPSTTKLSQLRTPSIETNSRRNPLVVNTVSSSHSNQPPPPPVQHTDGNYGPEHVVESGGTSPADHSSRDSVFSRWTDRSGATVASLTGGSVAGSAQGKSYLQDLGGGSYVTKTTEYTFENQTSETPAKSFLLGLTITADPNPESPTSPVFQSYQSPPSTPRLDRPLLQRSPSAHSSAPTLKGRHPRETMPLPPIPNYALAKFSKTQKEKTKWKAPDVWESNTSEPADTSTSTIEEEDQMIVPVQKVEEDGVVAYTLTRMQAEIKRMATASPTMIWVRLNETLSNADEPGMDVEIANEKKRWMFAAIHQLDYKTPNDQINSIYPRKNVPMVNKILALFESPAIASYLAALRNYAPVFHLSAQPLSHKIYPNVHPIQCPTVTSAALSVAPQSFMEVYCLSLPSLIPSSDIPQMLRSIHRCLAPGGCLRLILVDPAPIASSIGPGMRAWLEKHLLLNLERKFRCMNPTKLFPQWLQEVYLRGKGSTIVQPRFKAIAPRTKPNPDFRKPVDISVELYSQVGKMLWMEVWGDYVTAEKWWWEDRALVEECLAHDTTWEYNIITAVREDPE